VNAALSTIRAQIDGLSADALTILEDELIALQADVRWRTHLLTNPRLAEAYRHPPTSRYRAAEIAPALDASARLWKRMDDVAGAPTVTQRQAAATPGARFRVLQGGAR
jgi:hypothetical protein